MNIKKTMTILTIFLFSTNLVQTTFAQSVSHVKHDKSLLWKISGNGLEKPSYMYGTIHILDSAYFYMEEIVKVRFVECDKLVTEVDTDDPNFQKKTITAAMMKEDSIENLLSKEEYNKVDSFFTELLKIPLQAVNRIKPFYLSEMPVVLLIPKNTKSYEEEFKKMAKNQNKEILGISTVEKEAEIIDGIGLKVQAQILIESVDNYKSDYARMEKVLTLYQEYDISEIHNTIKAATDEHRVVYQVLFPNRHEVWIPKMESLMYNNSCFFAVGVGHLSGEQGLIELLKEKGYSVEPENMNQY